MQELINRILENGLADFEGLEVKGTLPLKQELVNEAIVEVLKLMQQVPPAPAAQPSITLDPRNLAGMVQKFEMQAVEGKVLLHFDIKR
jgi:hypothetical protein